MPYSCSAWGCRNRCSVETRSRGVTFHCFPKDNQLRKRWEVALRRKDFTATKFSRLCSEHFRQEDFDRTGQTVRLRNGAVPSIFSFPDHPRRSMTTRTSQTSKRARESLPEDCPPPVQKTEPQTLPTVDHAYALPTSKDLKARLNEALAQVESLEREIRKARMEREGEKQWCVVFWRI
ncbi:THAP domain-containing protein 6-like isoform X3 [Xyrichtys novacula]|uniref:THAP domain-containing protein 6-like isoform X3 n=1 Tax=Xyrichtys novacula TaxID=13765 RepID=A0AAV1F7D1_XYRNO|nr:THAP domain-containing protein 6-like isoform X3 [Xyrichtys novacula]